MQGVNIHLKKSKKVVIYIEIVIIIALILFGIVYYLVEVEINPIFKSLCEIRTKILATETINEAVKFELKNKTLRDNLIITTFDNNGKLVMLTTNAEAMNQLSANITERVQSKLKELKEQPFEITLGAVMNSWMFPDFGPTLKYGILPQGNVIVDFKSEFEESGINQTKYKLYISVAVQLKVVSPIVTSDINIQNNILISEIVIIGDVPESFTQFPINNR